MLPFTDAQKHAIEDADMVVPEVAELLREVVKNLKDAVVKLPHVNEDGERVVHGCNMQLHNREERINYAINFLENYL